MLREGHGELEHQALRDNFREYILASLPKMEPNKWYNLEKVFGDGFCTFSSREPPLYSAGFKDAGQIDMMLWFVSALDLSSAFDSRRDGRKRRIYYPIDEPNPNDIATSEEPHEEGKYYALVFHLETYGGYDSVLPHRYRLSLKSPNGIFVSETSPKLDDFDELKLESYAFFVRWQPTDSTQGGILCVPADHRKLTRLEIMLEEYERQPKHK